MRTLWGAPLALLIFYLYFPERGLFDRYVSKTHLGFFIFALFIIQGVNTFRKWKKEPSNIKATGNAEGSQSVDGTAEDVHASWLQRHQSIKVIALCAPVIFGAAAIVVAKAFRPGDSMALETTADRFFVNLFVVGIPLGLIGLPLLLIGIFHGIWQICRKKVYSIYILVMTLGIAAAIYIVIGTINAHKHTGESSNKCVQRIAQMAGSR